MPTAAPPPPFVPSVAPVAVQVEMGSIHLNIRPDAEVTLDGRSLGRVGARDVSVEAGPHTLRIQHPDYEPLQRKVTVRPGAATQVVLDLAEKAIRRQ
jgi:hypothetical protein